MTGVAGSVEASATVRIANVTATERDGGTVSSTTSADADGAFQAAIAARIGDELDVVAVDAAGNASPATPLTAGPPASSLQILPVGDDPQTGVAGQELPDPLQVKVVVAGAGTEVAGLGVTFEIAAGGGTLTATRATTDARGVATTRYRLGPDPGENQVVARIEAAPDKTLVLTGIGVGTPRVDSISPERAQPGDQVEIRGANFSPIARHDVVRFGSEAATVLEAETDRLTVEVPTFASGGPVTVTLTGVSSNSTTFEVIPVPVDAPPVGNVDLVTFTGASGTVPLPFEDAGTQYLLILEATAPTAQEFTATVRGEGATVASAGVSGGLAPAFRGVPRIAGESRIRAMERRFVPGLPRPSAAALRSLRPAQEPDVGSSRQFWVVNTSGAISISDRSNFDHVTATLRYKGQHTLLYVDQAAPATLTDAIVNEIGQRYDGETYARDTGAFGEPSDLDGNGKVIILLSPTVNGLTTQEIVDQGARIVGFFFGPDLLPDPTLNPFANAAEIFYAVVPDPNKTYGAAKVTVDEIVDLLSAVFAHEFEHMISFNQHVLVRAGQAEALWLDEALAHEAETLNGLHRQNQLRSAFFLQNPEETTLVGGGDQLDERGASWLFVQYLVDRFGEGVLGRLVQTRLTSITNVDAATDDAFQYLFHEWAATLYLDDTGITDDPTYAMPSVQIRTDFQEARQILNDDPTQPPVITGDFLDIGSTMLPMATAPISISQKGTSAAYLEVTARGRANAAVTIQGAQGEGLQVTVVRIR